MARYVVASLSSGVLFGIMDALINGNPLAARIMDCYKPIARQAVNVPAGMAIDLAYGFVICAVYLFILPVLPAQSGTARGIAFGLGMWFFRVVMNALSGWMMFIVPGRTLVYQLVTGLAEMLLLGIVIGLILKF